MQQGQVFSKAPSNWAYRYRLGGRDSKRMQRSGFPTEEAAEQALDRALERARQEQGLAQTPDAERARRDLPRPARHRARDARQTPLAAEQSDSRVREHADQRRCNRRRSPPGG